MCFVLQLENGIATLIHTMMTSKSAYHPIHFSHCLWFIKEVPDNESSKWETTVLYLIKKLKSSKNFSTISPDLWSDIKVCLLISYNLILQTK